MCSMCDLFARRCPALYFLNHTHLRGCLFSRLTQQVPGTTVLGRGNTVGSHAVVGSQSQDKKYIPGDACHLRVGDDNDIREHTQVHRSCGPEGCTTIGDGNLLQGSCHIGHDCAVGDGNILSNHTLLVSRPPTVLVKDSPLTVLRDTSLLASCVATS